MGMAIVPAFAWSKRSERMEKPKFSIIEKTVKECEHEFWINENNDVICLKIRWWDQWNQANHGLMIEFTEDFIQHIPEGAEYPRYTLVHIVGTTDNIVQDGENNKEHLDGNAD